MAMNVKPVPALDDEVNEIRLATAEIINKEILPNEAKLCPAFLLAQTKY